VRAAAVEAGRVARAALGSARETVREARRDAWRALFGGTVPRALVREGAAKEALVAAPMKKERRMPVRARGKSAGR
jgi:hypothetical protein